uniref:Uncharacterized protein n=1 Tax=Melanopsichium pennsylvanicum 4 TaxID=1398559 RepID=A0A077QZP8_9BASI|nr:uncharacterized protein BN887_06055 [Melanopsichium pennsylvanicum 4]
MSRAGVESIKEMQSVQSVQLVQLVQRNHLHNILSSFD